MGAQETATSPAGAGALHPMSVTAVCRERFRVDARAGSHAVRMDEPATVGGDNTGPTPGEMLLASLAACTAITVRMYADRKGWPIGEIRVGVEAMKDGASQVRAAVVAVGFGGAVDPAQHERLLAIAAKCPVHRALAPGVKIEVRGEDRAGLAGGGDGG